MSDYVYYFHCPKCKKELFQYETEKGTLGRIRIRCFNCEGKPLLEIRENNKNEIEYLEVLKEEKK